MVFAAAVFVFAVKIAYIRLFSHRPSWMSTQSAIRGADYQRISHPAVHAEGDNENGLHGEAQRTFLPQSNTEFGNDWDVD
ncbi:hypothetical protein PITC_015110 [Penicillium italicum]|uniref:Uncharacterized protein n=1 Tax=Penicillium italicum TaxID=40296 RepID=A0A0A2KTY3_PENIT|nr:hypothetical protein PITC_015110 [Penicillium italicum]